MKIATTARAALLFAACLAPIAGAQPMKVQESIAVESRPGQMLVHLTVENRSDLPVHVPRAVASDHELWGPLFEVRDAASGEPLEYSGRMVKRGPITAADYLAIAPHSKHTNTIDITGAYAFKPGTHTYRLTHVGHYLPDVARLDAQVAIEPRPVQFTYTGR